MNVAASLPVAEVELEDEFDQSSFMVRFRTALFESFLVRAMRLAVVGIILAIALSRFAPPRSTGSGWERYWIVAIASIHLAGAVSALFAYRRQKSIETGPEVTFRHLKGAVRTQTVLVGIAAIAWSVPATWIAAGVAATPIALLAGSAYMIGLLTLRHHTPASYLWIAIFVTAPPLLVARTEGGLVAVGVAVLAAALGAHSREAANQFLAAQEAGFRADYARRLAQEATDQIRALASHDELTGCLNRRSGTAVARSLLARRVGPRLGELSIAMVDIDNFKQVNDTYGHPAGDAVLREMGRRIRTTIRQADYVARVGGEEFMLLLPDTDLAVASLVAERLRCKVASEPIRTDATSAAKLEIRISIGVASAELSETLDEVLARADEALYAAKESGRNRVVEARRPRPDGARRRATS